MGRNCQFGRRRALGGAGAALALAAAPSAVHGQGPAVERVRVALAGGDAFHLHVLRAGSGKPTPGAVVVPDGWGVTPETLRLVERLAFEGAVAAAIDLFAGRVAASDAEAQDMGRGVDPRRGGAAVAAAFAWIRSTQACRCKVGAIGFGIGGVWAVDGSLGADVSATAVYYARIDRTERELRDLDGALVAHYAAGDMWATSASAIDLEVRRRPHQRATAIHRYNSRPGFANPLSRAWDRPDAGLAWTRTATAFRAGLGLA